MVPEAVVAKFPILWMLQKAARTESSPWTSGNVPGNWLTSVSIHPQGHPRALAGDSVHWCELKPGDPQPGPFPL